MERIILKARSIGISTYAQGVCDAEAKTGSAAGTRQAAAPGVPNSELARKGQGDVGTAGSEFLKKL